MKKTIAISLVFAAFFIVSLTTCNGPLEGNYRTIHLTGFEEESSSNGSISGGGGVLDDSTEIIEIENKLKSKLDDLLKALADKKDGESVSGELEVDGSTCVVTLKKDGGGYNVAIGGVNLTNEHALKGLLRGMQEGLPDDKPIDLDFSGSGGEWMPSIVGLPEVKKERFFSVILPDTVTDLYQAKTTEHGFVRTFDGFTNLKTVTAPGVTEISSNAFTGLTNLETVNIPNANSIGEAAFENCSSLTTLTVDKEKITVIKSSAFRNCQSLEKIDFPNVTTIEMYAFEGCSSLISTADNPLFQNPEKIVSIGKNAFEGCTTLEKVYFPRLTEIPDLAFSDCTNLKSLQADWASVGTIGEDAFYNCKNLEAVNFSTATGIGFRAFAGCEKLAGVNIPHTRYIDDGAFEDCKALTEVKFPLAINMGVAAFRGCTSLVRADLRAAEKYPDSPDPAGLTFARCIKLETLILPKWEQFKNHFFMATGTGDDGVGTTGTATPLCLYLNDSLPSVGNHIFGESGNWGGLVSADKYVTIYVSSTSVKNAYEYNDGSGSWITDFTGGNSKIHVTVAVSALPTP